MTEKQNKSKFEQEIEALSKVSIEGRLFDETPETVVIQTKHSLLEIHRDDIENISKIQSEQEKNLVSVSMSRTANIMEKTLTTAGLAAILNTPGVAAMGWDDLGIGGRIVGTTTILGKTYYVVVTDTGDRVFVEKKWPDFPGIPGPKGLSL